MFAITRIAKAKNSFKEDNKCLLNLRITENFNLDSASKKKNTPASPNYRLHKNVDKPQWPWDRPSFCDSAFSIYQFRFSLDKKSREFMVVLPLTILRTLDNLLYSVFDPIWVLYKCYYAYIYYL